MDGGFGGWDWSWGEEDSDYWSGGSALEVKSAEIEGDLGSITTFGGHATDSNIQTSHWDGYDQVTVTVVDDEGAAMNIVEIQGGLNHPDLEPGSRLHFDNNVFPDADDLQISVIGCAGPSPGNWDYDRPAEEVDVEVEQDPNDEDVLMLKYTAYFPRDNYGWNGSGAEYHTVSGVIAVVRPNAN
jgi:hypothetical protein